MLDTWQMAQSCPWWLFRYLVWQKGHREIGWSCREAKDSRSTFCSGLSSQVYWKDTSNALVAFWVLLVLTFLAF